jgi:hypothetical protein
MAEVEDTIKLFCNPQEIENEAEWIEMKDWQNLTKVHINLSRECRNWVAGETESILNDIVLQHSHPGDHIIYIYGSVIRGKKSSWGFVVYISRNLTTIQSSAFEITTPCMRTEIQDITEMWRWLEKVNKT